DVVFFFFSSRRRHTRFSRDWSSDVCSSDLECRVSRAASSRSCVISAMRISFRDETRQLMRMVGGKGMTRDAGKKMPRLAPGQRQIGRASCRERGEVGGGGASGQKKRTGPHS